MATTTNDALKPGTLGYHYAYARAVFGEESRATKYLAEKIAEEGEDSEVMISEAGMIFLLGKLHFGTEKEATEGEGSGGDEGEGTA